MTDQEKFIALLGKEELKKSDAIVMLEGDGYFRCKHAAALYKQRWAKIIVISGGITNHHYGSYPAKKLWPELAKLGVKRSDMLLDEESMNTREQAVNIIKLATEKKWKKIILVASHYHQYRAFLTFLQVLRATGAKLRIINSPANDLPWFQNNKWGRRIDLLESEFEQINIYRKKNHVASYAEALAYFKSNE
ncbi:MAG: YdcF family protein [Patescibacteria group bacterium]|nr:YdcF family protein [Patescibacteria group bacterium]